MRVGSLFTGYGGLDMALGGDLAWYAEIEPAACRVLAAHYPGVPNLGDIKLIKWDEVEPVNVITGGYPCQPFSTAGNRKGKDDERHLWPFVRDAIRTLRPEYAILENVAGHLSLGFADVLADLAEIGWDAEWATVRASDVGACHQRARLFIIAHTSGRAACEPNDQNQILRPATESGKCAGIATDTDSERHGGRERPPEVAGMGSASKSSRRQTSTTRQESRTGGNCSADNTNGESWDVKRQEDTPSEKPSCQPEQHTHTQSGRAGRLSRSDQPAADTDDRHGQAVRPMPRLERHAARSDMHAMSDTNWGQYAAAIHRWEHIIGRPAPAPTFAGTTGRPRLNPVFVEWMMGLPEGWVTGHGLSSAQCLKMLGNGVVPQQAAHAIRHLTKGDRNATR